MKEVDTKKLVLGCLVIMLFMIVYTKVTTTMKSEKTEVTVEVDNATGKSSIFLSEEGFHVETVEAGEKTTAQETDEEDILGPAEEINLNKARKESYGVVVELDRVSADSISFHGMFGYLVFSLGSSDMGNVTATLENAVTFSELGGLTMGGSAYTDVLAGDGCALIVPGIHNKEIARRRKFLYVEETNEITGGIMAPEWMREKMAKNDYTDTVVEEEFVHELTAKLRQADSSKLLYGPVVVPEYDSNIYGFLAESGSNLEDIWYGLWNKDTDTVTKIVLFE